MTYSGLSSASGILGVVGQGSSTMSLLIPGATATANAADTNFTNNAILDVKVNYRTP